MKTLHGGRAGPGTGMTRWASEHQYRRLFESTKDGILILDVGSGRIVDVNPSLEVFLECAGDELIGTEVWKVPAFRPVVATREALADWEAQEILRFVEVSLRKKDGTHLDLEIVGNVYQAAGQRVVQWNIRDITQKKLAEGKIAALNADLEKRVVERTAELAVANKELKRAIEVADNANRAKSDFLASMSHEIRTPLNAIIGFCELALQADCHPSPREFLGKIQKAGTVLLGILNDILDISKVEKGLLELEEIDFELDEILHNVFSTVEVKAREKGLEILLDAPADLPRHFRGDPLRLGQILVNLVGNAVKFTNQGEVVVEISVLEKNADKVRLGVVVRDTGIGIPDEHLGHLFRPFSQADSSTTRKFGGTGLGLSICKKLVEMMGGEIGATSEPGRGTRFHLSVVLKTAGKGTTGVILPENLRGLRVLVVDDNSATLQVFTRLLGMFPLVVEGAQSSQRAIELIREKDLRQAFDLILLDFKLPDQNGLEVTRQIKNDVTLKKVPLIIMFTAVGEGTLHAHALEAGADDFLLKPVTISNLIGSMQKVFHRAETPRGFSPGDSHPVFPVLDLSRSSSRSRSLSGVASRIPSPPGIVRSGPDFLEELMKFRKLLARNDFKACRILRDLKERFFQTWGLHPGLPFIEKLISQFHFDEAGIVTESVIQKLQEAQHGK